MATTSPSQTDITTSNVPSYLQPYATTLAGDVASYVANNPNYTPFQGQGLGGTQIAGLSPLQTQAMQGIQGMQVSPLTSQAAGIFGAAANNAQGIAGSYQPFQAGNQYVSPNVNVNAMPTSNYTMSAANPISGVQGTAASMNAANPITGATTTANQMTGPQNVSGAQGIASQMAGPQQYTGSNVSQYMTPYLQTAQNQAIQNYANSLPQLGSAATSVGGLGGSREALMQAQAQQGLQQTLAGNVANAFQNAQQQFNTSQAQQLQAGQANLGAQMQAEQQNIGNLQQANLANQGYQYQTAAQNLGAAQQTGLANLANIQQGYLANQANQQAANAQNASMAQQMGLANQATQQAANLQNQTIQQQTGTQNLQSLINQYQYGAGQNMTAQQANQQAGLQEAGNTAQYGLAGQQLNSQQQQFLANLGLNANQQLMGAGQSELGAGQQDYSQQAGIYQAQMGAGAVGQNTQQNLYNAQYQNYLNSMNYLPALYSYESGILHGASPASLGGQYAASTYTPQPSTAQLAGVGLTAALGTPGLFGNQP